MRPGGFVRHFEDDDYCDLPFYDQYLIQNLRNCLKLRNASGYYRVVCKGYLRELKDRRDRGVYPGCG